MRIPTIICLSGIICFACNHLPSNTEPAPAPNTAAYKLADVSALAQSIAPGLRLMVIRSSDVNTDGTSQTWQYMYADTAVPPVCFWFHATPASVVSDSTTPMMVGSGVIRHRWFNSDSALMLAEQHGGSQFRSSNPEYTIYASLGEPVVPNARTFWWVTYQSSANPLLQLTFSIEADSATVKVFPVR